MNQATLHTELYRVNIARILDEVGLGNCSLDFVSSIREWAKSVNMEAQKSDPLAMAVLAGGKPLIVLKREITERDRPGVLGRMMVSGFDDAEISRIDTPEAFLEHLVLHEAAHLLLPDGASEEECDQWAFDRLRLRIPAATA